MTICSLVDRCDLLGGTQCETSNTFPLKHWSTRTTLGHISEYSNLNIHSCENLKCSVEMVMNICTFV